MHHLFTLLCFLAIFQPAAAQAPEIHFDEARMAFSAIRGQASKVGYFMYTHDGRKVKGLRGNLSGADAAYFTLVGPLPTVLRRGDAVRLAVQFQPPADFIGLADAELQLRGKRGWEKSVELRGLSTKALEGKNEPPLADVVAALNYPIELGWRTLGHHLRPAPQGEELSPTKFKKADGADMVEIIPVARYSPPFPLPFGYYTAGGERPVLREIGTLADSENYPEHQTLYPYLATGATAFDPGGDAFGFFTSSPSHVAYSDDRYNAALHPDKAAHACRIYPLKRKDGTPLPGQYLVCFEEASNGDYQDYVFLVRNVTPVVGR